VKLCRLLSSHGDPISGYFGAQLVSAGNVMGPGAARAAAEGLAFVAAHAENAEDDASVEAVALAWRERSGGRFGGFGVPFRPEDERLLMMRRFVAGTALERRPYWRLQVRVTEALAKHAPDRPNIALGDAALMLDAGIHPSRCGVALSMLMSHLFLAHALEAADTDGPALRALPPSVVDYRGAAPRSTASPSPAVSPPPALRRHAGVATGGPTAYETAGR
jgi:hypothetical protein